MLVKGIGMGRMKKQVHLLFHSTDTFYKRESTHPIRCHLKYKLVEHDATLESWQSRSVTKRTQLLAEKNELFRGHEV